MIEWTTLQKECQELKKNEETWNETKQQYCKIMIDYKHKKEGLEREKELQLQEQETNNNTIKKMSLQILHMKFMILQKRNSINRR